MAFIGAWGTGKTMLLKHCAMQLARQGEKVLFIVTQRGDIMTSNVKTQLILELEETFKEFGDLIKVISLPITNGQRIHFEELTQDYPHLVVDEFFDDFDRFQKKTIDEIMKVFNNKVTVAITLSNSYFNQRIPSDTNIQKKVETMLPGFIVIMLDKPLRQPLNIATELQEQFKDIGKTRDLTFNERLVSEATLSPNLIQGLDTLYFGEDEVQSLFTLLKEAFLKASKEALIIIEDNLSGHDAYINAQISKLIKCQCQDKAIYIAIDMALERSGRLEPYWQTLRKQSPEDDNKAWIAGKKQNHDLVLSHSLMKGCESEFIINTTGQADVTSRVSGQFIQLLPHMYLTLLVIAEYLNTQAHVCDEILDRKKRPPMLESDIHPLIGKLIKISNIKFS